ncbi:MAG: PHP domain-containing protein [Christensenellales bacterium]
MKYDLHIHSIFSDGTDAPVAIVEKAKQKGLSAIALTDHDTIDGLDECRDAAKSAGIEFVDGLELSTYSMSEVHILGYGFDRKSDRLHSALSDFAARRVERIKNILALLGKFKINLDYDSVASNAGGAIGRMHVANELIKKGFCTSVHEAFDRYLGVNGLAYVPSKRITPMEGVKLIKNCKGLAILAHPLRFLQTGKFNDFVYGLKPFGLDGVEAYYPTHDEKTVRNITMIAKQNGMIVTGGTDYHGANKNVELGSVDVRLDDKAKKKLKIK